MNRHPTDDPSTARVREVHGLLFPVSPRELCDQIDLNWWAAAKLFTDDWLSFDPESVPHLDEAQEAELCFLGALVNNGCEPNLLSKLLSGLEKPYCYRADRIYYDWTQSKWRLLPDQTTDAEAVSLAWIRELADNEDVEQLESLREEIDEALSGVGEEAEGRTKGERE